MRLIVLLGVMVLLAGCGSETPPPSGEPGLSASACADGGARLSQTGLCQSEARALLVSDPGVRSPELANCTWAIKEVMLPGDEALLYRAATCNGVETSLTFAGGAHRAEISYERSAVYGDAGKERVVIQLYGVDPDPQGALKAAIAEAPKEKTGPCEIVPAAREGWPTDALLIAPSAAARARVPPGTRLVACGPTGIDETKVSYWRVRQGFAWFFDLGDKDPDFDAGNVSMVVKGGDGAWRVKP